MSIKQPEGEFLNAKQTTIAHPGGLIFLAGKPADLDMFARGFEKGLTDPNS